MMTMKVSGRTGATIQSEQHRSQSQSVNSKQTADCNKQTAAHSQTASTRTSTFVVQQGDCKADAIAAAVVAHGDDYTTFTSTQLSGQILLECTETDTLLSMDDATSTTCTTTMMVFPKSEVTAILFGNDSFTFPAVIVTVIRDYYLGIAHRAPPCQLGPAYLSSSSK